MKRPFLFCLTLAFGMVFSVEGALWRVATAGQTVPQHAEQLDPALMPMTMSCGERINVWAPVASVEEGFAKCAAKLKVLNIDTGRAVIVTVIDDAQFGNDGVTILLSPQAADLIGMKERAPVAIIPLREKQ